METLVANIGGYIGLFLGYAILQIPSFFRHMFEYTKRIIAKKVEISSEHIKLKLSSTLEQDSANKDQTNPINDLDCLNDDVMKMKQDLSGVENVLYSIGQGVQRIEHKLVNMTR